MLSSKDIERVTISLIRAEQDRLIGAGKMHRDAHIDARTGPLQNKPLSGLAIDDDGLGFDSLARLALVERVNRFFGLSATGIEDYLLVHRMLPEWVDLIAEHFRRVGDSAVFTFGSSGSTGNRGFHPHGWRALQSEVGAHLVGAFAPGARPQRVLSSVPVHHIYGFLWGVLIPAALGKAAIDLPAGAPGAALRSARPGDALLTTPFGLARLAEAVASGATGFPTGVTGILSGGPSTPESWRAGPALGLARMIEIYGASETGGLGWRTAADAPFQCVADLSGTAPEALHRPGVSAPLAVQDVLVWQEGATFLVQGRKDKVVQVGGTNVSLDAVRQALLEEPQVREASVRLDGERLKAFIVPALPARVAPRQLEKALRDRLAALPAPARPDRYTFGPALPRSATGKLQDWDSATA